MDIIKWIGSFLLSGIVLTVLACISPTFAASFMTGVGIAAMAIFFKNKVLP